MPHGWAIPMGTYHTGIVAGVASHSLLRATALLMQHSAAAAVANTSGSACAIPASLLDQVFVTDNTSDLNVEVEKATDIRENSSKTRHCAPGHCNLNSLLSSRKLNVTLTRQSDASLQNMFCGDSLVRHTHQ